VNVYRTFLFDFKNAEIAQIGQARRTVFEQNPPPTQQGIVVGIIESGPPVPNENVAVLAAQQLLGTSSFGDMTSSTTGWTINASIGGFLQISGSGGLPGGYTCNVDFMLSFGINCSFSQETTQQTISTCLAPSSTISDSDGNIVINPQGSALVYHCSFIGYMFQFLDSNGNPVPGTTPYYELYPTNAVISTYPFDYPESTTGVYPGSLSTYFIDGPGLDQLEQSLLNGASVAQFSWGDSSDYQVSTASITQGSHSVGTYVNFAASVGVTMGPPGNSVTATAGLNASFNFTYTWTTVTNDSLQTIVTLLAPNQPPPTGAYGSYDYDVLLLAHNQQYTADLIALLNSNPTTLNQTLLGVIAPNSAPWKMVHVVTSSELEGAGEQPVPGGEVRAA
jgi:hypothetical protein